MLCVSWTQKASNEEEMGYFAEIFSRDLQGIQPLPQTDSSLTQTTNIIFFNQSISINECSQPLG